MAVGEVAVIEPTECTDNDVTEVMSSFSFSQPSPFPALKKVDYPFAIG